MRNLLRQPLTWMVIAECILVAILTMVVWNAAASAAAQHASVLPPVQAGDASASPSDLPVPNLMQGVRPVVPPQLPGLNLDAGFWRYRLSQLNRDQVFFEQLEWRIVHNAMDAAQGYLETVVVPSITRAERAGRSGSPVY